ncbi:MAG: agmatinase [Proteobacteria bacterium]|nr:agmatinase [Pseudomonadota bacterium]
MAQDFNDFLNFKSDYKDAYFVIIPVPMEITVSYGHGTSKGPQAIIDSIFQLEAYDIEFKKEAIDVPVHTMDVIQANDAPGYIERIRQSVSKCVKDGKIPIVLGGEHSLSYGVFLGLAEHKKNISILHFDSHLDLRDSYEDSKYSHASVMKRIREHTGSIHSVVSVGIRSESSEEAYYVAKSGHKILYAQDIYRKDVTSELNKVLGDTLYITFDIDVFDPSIMPSTGTPEPGGLEWYQTLDILKAAVKGRKVIGFDIVELAPDGVNHHSEFTTAKLLYKMMAYTLNFGVR